MENAFQIIQIVLGIVTTAVLAVTACIVWLYTKAAQRSNEIQEQPVLNLTLEEEDNQVNKWYVLKVKNVGHAPAYNIIFSKLTASEYTYHPHFKKKFSNYPSVKRETNPVLEVGDEGQLHFWVKKLPNITEVYDPTLGFRWFLSRFFPRDAEQIKHEELKRTSAVFVLNYEGVSGKKYHSVFRVYSKIWPILDVYDLVSEFVRTGEGQCTADEAKLLCAEKETIQKFPE